MVRIIRFALLIMLAALNPAAYAQPLDVDSVLDRAMRAYGGEKNLRKLDNMVQEWDMVALMGNRHGSDVRRIRVPDHLEVELTYPEKTEVRILAGDMGHNIFDGGQPTLASPPQRDAMRLQIMRLYSPLVLYRKKNAITLTEGGDYCVLSLVEKGVQTDYLVSRNTWHIEKVVGTLSINGTQMQFLTEYSDFDFEDGVLVHHSENKFAGGVNTARLQLKKISFGDGNGQRQLQSGARNSL